MKEIWFKDCETDEARTKRENELRSYTTAFEALKDLLDTMTEHPTSDYDRGDWALKMADINGANRMLKKISSLITIKE